MDLVHERAAGINISKSDVKVAIRAPGKRAGTFTIEVTTWGSTTNQILALRDMLLAAKVTTVVMEATSDYWKPFYYLFEDVLPVMLVNAKAARNIPGRKTDVLTERTGPTPENRRRRRLASAGFCSQGQAREPLMGTGPAGGPPVGGTGGTGEPFEPYRLVDGPGQNIGPAAYVTGLLACGRSDILAILSSEKTCPTPPGWHSWAPMGSCVPALSRHRPSGSCGI